MIPPCNPPLTLHPLPVHTIALQTVSSGLRLSSNTQLPLPPPRIPSLALAATLHDAQRVADEDGPSEQQQPEVRATDHADEHAGELDTTGTWTHGRDGFGIA